MITIKDVAKHARVSIGSVSRVLNNKDRVSDETKQRVLEAVKHLGYQPNMLAQSLKTRRSYTIGLVIENITNPYFPEIIKGVEEKAKDYGYSVFLCDNQRDPSKGITHLEALQNRGVDGIIYSSGRNLDVETAEKMRSLIKKRTPIVFLWRDHTEVNISSIHNNEEGAASLIVNHLIGLGHKRIGFIGGLPEFWVTEQRLNGYRAALMEHHLYDPELVVYSNFEVSGGKEQTLQLMNLPSPPTAIFAIDDLMGIGALMAAKSMGLKVPEQLAIVGFNNIAYSEYTDPPMTTISFPRYEMGKLAVEKLFAQLNGSKNKKIEHVTLEGELIIRGSCGALPNFTMD